MSRGHGFQCLSIPYGRYVCTSRSDLRKDNSKSLQKLGLEIEPHLPATWRLTNGRPGAQVHRKEKLLYTALVSPKHHGEWQIAPSDGGDMLRALDSFPRRRPDPPLPPGPRLVAPR